MDLTVISQEIPTADTGEEKKNSSGRPRYKLPTEAVQFPFLKVFKTQLDKTLSNLTWPYTWP